MPRGCRKSLPVGARDPFRVGPPLRRAEVLLLALRRALVAGSHGLGQAVGTEVRLRPGVAAPAALEARRPPRLAAPVLLAQSLQLGRLLARSDGIDELLQRLDDRHAAKSSATAGPRLTRPTRRAPERGRIASLRG